MLDIKRPTLYAYVSRGMVRSVPAPRGRARRYARADLQRLVARRDARKGHGPVAAAALRWGEPVLDSAITEITAAGPRYRGHLAGDLAKRHSFEAVAELLWSGTRKADVDAWPKAKRSVRIDGLLPESASPIARMMAAVPLWAARDQSRHGATMSAELARARVLIGSLARCLGPGKADKQTRIAGIAARALGVPATPRRITAIDRALVACADHELNVSAFAARVAASAGADVYACLSAALAAMSGPLHGGASDRVEALVRECGSAKRAGAVVRQRVARGDGIPGFGHPLYPEGDPRARWLLREARAIDADNRVVATLAAIARAMKRAERPGPNLDFGLVALRAALRLPPGSAAGLFALGRSAGWVAHALEQREAGFLLRPRARFSQAPAG